MVGFQEVVEIWGVYWFGRCLGRGWWEFLVCKVEKGRLKWGSDDLLTWMDGEVVLEIPLHMGFKFHAGYAGLLRLFVIYRYKLKYMF